MCVLVINDPTRDLPSLTETKPEFGIKDNTEIFIAENIFQKGHHINPGIFWNTSPYH